MPLIAAVRFHIGLGISLHRDALLGEFEHLAIASSRIIFGNEISTRPVT